MEEKKNSVGRPQKLKIESSNLADYMKQYKQKKYEEDPTKCKRIRLSYMHKKKYEIPKEMLDKYGENICCAIQLKEIYNNFGKELFKNLSEDLEKMNFPRKN